MDSSDRLHHILVVEDPSFIREINLDAATYSLGRHSSNDIVLSCQKTSRNHATLLRRTDLKTNKCSYWILDGDLQGNRSRNGIYINGKKGLVHELKSGDTIQFSGDAKATYKASTELPAQDKRIVQVSEQLLPPGSANKDTVVNPPQVSPAKVNLPEATSVVNATSSNQQASLAELSPQPIIEIDLYGNITYINSAGIIHFKDIHHQKLNHPLLKNIIAKYHKGDNNIINREVTVDNKTFWQTAHYLPEKRVIRNYVVDITKQKQLELEINRENTVYKNIIDRISEGVILAEPATKQIVEVNVACSDLLGYSVEELLQMNIYELAYESNKLATVLQRLIAEQNNFSGDFILQSKNNHIINTKVKLELIGLDNQEKICIIINSPKSSRSEVGGLTASLSQRELFDRQIATAIANSERSEKLMAVMFCQLDSFTDIQNVVGTEKLEQFLATMKQRLSSCLRAGDTVVHWQDHKFAILLPQISGVEEVAKINRRIQELIEQSFQLGQTQVTTKIYSGVAIYPQDGSDGEILLASANTALERAYKSKHSYQFYDEAINSQVMVALELEALLQQALEHQEFELYYQPQINIATGQLEAVKALLRWQHPELGLVTPRNFIKSAEQSKLIVPIGEWSILTACQQNKAWQSQGLPSAKVTVSLSSIQFKQPNLTQTIAEILAKTALEPQLLELEISAVSLMENVEHSRHLLSQLKSIGVSIAVDSFTAGFSTLEYLKQFPLDTLKIDHSLVENLTNNPQDLAVVAALIELGEGFNLRVVAEGVENQEQVDLLRQLDCQQMEGFWFGRPLAAEEASKLLQLNYPENLEITGGSVQLEPESELDEAIAESQAIDSE